jgi:hypothetical protein
MIDGLPVISPSATGDWQTAAKAQVLGLLSNFNLSMPGEVLYVRTLVVKDGKSKLEAGLNSPTVAKAVRRAFFSFVRPNSPLRRPSWLKSIQINPVQTAGTRIRVLIMKVGQLSFFILLLAIIFVYRISSFLV